MPFSQKFGCSAPLFASLIMRRILGQGQYPRRNGGCLFGRDLRLCRHGYGPPSSASATANSMRKIICRAWLPGKTLGYQGKGRAHARACNPVTGQAITGLDQIQPRSLRGPRNPGHTRKYCRYHPHAYFQTQPWTFHTEHAQTHTELFHIKLAVARHAIRQATRTPRHLQLRLLPYTAHFARCIIDDICLGKFPPCFTIPTLTP